MPRTEHIPARLEALRLLGKSCEDILHALDEMPDSQATRIVEELVKVVDSLIAEVKEIYGYVY